MVFKHLVYIYIFFLKIRNQNIMISEGSCDTEE